MGINVEVVYQALGHASTAFTMDTYAHVLPTMGEQVAQAIEASLGERAAGKTTAEIGSRRRLQEVVV